MADMGSLRREVTPETRIMVPVYAFACAAYGLVYLLNPLGRLRYSHANAVQKQIMGGSMEPWGLLFLLLAGVMLLAILWGSRNALILVLSICAFAWFLWGVLYIFSVARDPQASVLAPVLPWVTSAACVATTGSLMRKAT